MTHQNDVAGRDVEKLERWGIAPSVAFGRDSTRGSRSRYLHQEDDNVPQYGVPYALGAFNDGPLLGVPTSAYYGYANLDTQEIGVDALTAVMTHDFTGNFSLRNLTRWQQVDQFSFVDQPQGTWCIETGVNPWTGAAALRRARSSRTAAARCAIPITRFSSIRRTSPSSSRRAKCGIRS